MGQKLRHFRFRHLSRVPLLVKKNESLDPIHVGLLGPDRVMFQPDRIANAIEQFAIVWGGAWGYVHGRISPNYDQPSDEPQAD